MSSGFTFGNHSTWDFSMHIEKYPSIGGAKRKRTTISVPGRNGDLHYTENAFENYQQPYQCYFHGDHPAPALAHKIQSWLLGSGEYLRLTDTYDPTHYRMATYIGPLDIENHLNKYGRCVVNFDCAPQSFLYSGDYPTEFAATGIINNPTAFTALPVITIYGGGGGTVTVGGTTVTIKDMEDQIILDCEKGNAYRQVGEGASENMNDNIYAPVFPELLPGDNIISFTGGVTKIEIIPRWWEL